MTLSNWINFLLLIVSVIAAGIAWRAVFAARASAREANETSKQMLRNDDARRRDEIAAKFQAEFHVYLGWGDTYGNRPRQIRIKNIGTGGASNVKLYYNRRDVRTIGNIDARFLPDYIVKDEEVFIEELELKVIQTPAEIYITWNDVAGDPKRLRQTLNDD
jgi:hypothetical protein